MTSCSTCGQTILFSGIRQEAGVYCSDACAEAGATERISESDVDWCATKLHQADCPCCKGPGPTDLHPSHKIISVIVLSYRESKQTMGCAQCGRSAQIRDFLITLFAGWWSLSGLLWTPIMLVCNLVGVCTKRDLSLPSPELRALARRQLGKERLGGGGSLTAILAEAKGVKANQPRTIGETKTKGDIEAFLTGVEREGLDGRTLAWRSLACGIVALILSVVVGIPCGIAAIVTGVKAQRRLAENADSFARFLAIVGVVTGSLGALVQLWILVILVIPVPGHR